MSRIKALSVMHGLTKGMYLSIWMIFLTNNGASLMLLGVLGTVFEATRFVFEMPTGLFSDKIGRKITLAISYFFGFIAIFLMVMFRNPSAYIVAIAILALSDSFATGGYESWTTDYLIEIGKEELLEKSICSIYIHQLTGVVIGAAITAIMGAPQLALTGAAILYGSSSVLSMFLKEPMRKTSDISESVFKLLKISFKTISGIWFVKVWTVAMFVYALSNDGVERYYQNFLYDVGVGENTIPIVLVLSAATSIFILVFMNKYFTKLKGMVVISLLFIAMGAVVLFSVLLGGMFSFMLIVIYFGLNDVMHPVVQAELNKRIPSNIRATTLSSIEFIGSFGELVSGIIFGLLASYFGLGTTFTVTAVCFITIGTMLTFTKGERNV